MNHFLEIFLRKAKTSFTTCSRVLSFFSAVLHEVDCISTHFHFRSSHLFHGFSHALAVLGGRFAESPLPYCTFGAPLLLFAISQFTQYFFSPLVFRQISGLGFRDAWPRLTTGNCLSCRAELLNKVRDFSAGDSRVLCAVANGDLL